MNAELGRLVLDHVTAHREQLDMTLWGDPDGACGTSACIAGWALIFSGWSLAAANTFCRESDGYEMPGNSAIIETEARRILDLGEGEFWRTGPGGDDSLFSADDDEAVEWLREFVEKAEAGRG